MKIFGMKFAPLRIPLQRRLEILAAATWATLLGIAGPVFLIFLIYLLFTNYWLPSLIYLFWIWIIDKDICEKGGRRSEWVRSWNLWKYNRDYYPIKLIVNPEISLDPKKNYLFCSFPHGILATGAFNAFGTDANNFKNYFPHHIPNFVTSIYNFYMPFLRDILLGMGCIASSAKSINYVLGKPDGKNICILVVGGLAETYYCKPGLYKIVLENRKGFVKLALQNGSPLVPVLSFGETDLYDQIEGSTFRRLQETFRKWTGFPLIIPKGRGFFQYTFGIIPHKCPITVVVGPPMEIPKIEEPSQDQINDYHKKFMKLLVQLFEEQKYEYLEDPKSKELIIC